MYKSMEYLIKNLSGIFKTIQLLSHEVDHRIDLVKILLEETLSPSPSKLLGSVAPRPNG